MRITWVSGGTWSGSYGDYLLGGRIYTARERIYRHGLLWNLLARCFGHGWGWTPFVTMWIQRAKWEAERE